MRIERGFAFSFCPRRNNSRREITSRDSRLAYCEQLVDCKESVYPANVIQVYRGFN